MQCPILTPAFIDAGPGKEENSRCYGDPKGSECLCIPVANTRKGFYNRKEKPVKGEITKGKPVEALVVDSEPKTHHKHVITACHHQSLKNRGSKALSLLRSKALSSQLRDLH